MYKLNRQVYKEEFNVITIDNKKTGERIKTLMAENGITNVQLQKIFGFTTAVAICKWRSGKNIPSIDNLFVLADVFGCTIEDIVVVNRG